MEKKYGVAVTALKDILKHLDAMAKGSVLLLPVGIIARRALKQMGEIK